MIVLRNDHYIDSPADVIVLETSVKARNDSHKVNGVVKQTYPGWYECVKAGMVHNAKQGSVFVCQSVGLVPGRNKPIVIAGSCLYSPTRAMPSSKDVMYAMNSLIEWFWSQDVYLSIGMNLLGVRSKAMQFVNSSIQDHQKAWDKYRNDREDRVLYLHSVESTYLAPVQAKHWSGAFSKVCIWNPLFPQLES